jgi:uncharacterized protein (DUF1800 family)
VIESGAESKRDRILHVLNRLAFGPRPGDYERVSAIGPERYVQEQLHPESIPIPGDLRDRVNQYRTLHMTPVALFAEYQRPLMEARKDAKAGGSDKASTKDATKDARIQQRIVMREAVEARMMRAVEGPRQLQEVMTAFWFNHFNIFAGKGLDNIWTGAFEETAIRPHTFGKFRTLLGATAHHPAMLFYLDNWQNTAPGSPGSKGKFEGINENYARELMELHTLGVNGGYSQADVIALAHILTGWGLPRPGGGGGGGNRRPDGPNLRGAMRAFFPFGGFRQRRQNLMRAPVDPSGFFFDAERHDSSSKIFLERQIEGDGMAEGEQALDILARSPATANHLSFKLAQYFVADDPPKVLVSRMAQRYLATDGEIRAVLETMFMSAEFRDPRYYGAKFKTPYEYVISCVRASGVPILNYRPLYGTMQVLGMPLYGCQTPNGYANTQEAWLNPDAMMTRLSFATALGSGNLPLENPPFEEDADGGGAMRREPAVVSKKGAGKVNIKFDPGAHGPRMTPPDPAQLAATLGDYFSPATADAVEASPTQLRAPLILGSPEFMKR